MASSFPCLVCGKELERAFNEIEDQPHNAVACITYGNYGSRVYDPLDGSYLAFNICDDCLVAAGKQGRLYTTRDHVPVVMEDIGRVGWIKKEHPFISWTADLSPDEIEYVLTEDELNNLPDFVHLTEGFTPENIRETLEHRRNNART